ncbi:MAG: aminotransferase class III-fold pyridoxal phosphate-dependent enzyme, partial [Thermodesulfobacteriota bacterium]
PLFLVRGEGCHIYDADGNQYLDFINNYTSLIHGSAHPAVVAAANAQSALGAAFPAPHEKQYLLAELIRARVESVDQIRYCNSGTEATMHAIRGARAFTRKPKIIKIEGGYHGTHDTVEVSVHPALEKIGPVEAPLSVPENHGITPNTCRDVIVIPFNNPEVAERVVTENAHETAGLILEPMMGSAGLLTPRENYLQFLRELTARAGILLIFDEVITFRLGLGGMQGLYGVKPDLTAFGKIIGGGYPVGAFGGPQEIMNIYSPLESEGIFHSGTFNGNPVTMAAGLATMEHYGQAEIDRINTLGGRLRAGLEGALAEAGIKGRALGLGSLGQIHFNTGDIVDFRSSLRGNGQILSLIHLAMLNRGLYFAPRGMIALSTPMSEKEIDTFTAEFREVLAWVRPFVEETAPDLLS